MAQQAGAGVSGERIPLKKNQNKSIDTSVVFCHTIDDLINDILSIVRSLSLFFPVNIVVA